MTKTRAAIELNHRGFRVEMTRKDIASLRLRVTPVTGEIKLSVPRYADLTTVYAFLDKNHAWLAQAQHRMRSIEAPEVRPLAELGQVRIWGELVPLEVRDGARAAARLEGSRLVVTGADDAAHRRALDSFYKAEMARVAPEIVAHWEPIVGRYSSALRYRRMKTRWGSCNVRTRAINLNLALAEKTPDSLEYVVVHELTHLHEASHGPAFYAWMDRLLPDWPARKRSLRAQARAADCAECELPRGVPGLTGEGL